MLDINTLTQLLFKGLIDAHNIGRFGEADAPTVVRSGWFSTLVDRLKNLENKSYYSVISGQSDQFARIY